MAEGRAALRLELPLLDTDESVICFAGISKSDAKSC